MRRTWLIFSQAVTVAVAILFVIATFRPDWLQRRGARGNVGAVSIFAAPPALAASDVPASGSGYSRAAQHAAPSVVSITASKSPRRAAHYDDPWFQYFFGEQLRQQQQSQVGLGSGVIVAPEGYLITNHHVIDGADDIEVQLIDGRKAQARLVGSDPASDIALLKIQLGSLPVATFGDADALQVGDAVLAIGNPFNVGQTVTAGIVSALGRNQLGINTFENFIQTDAAINPGNSGGALVDAAGNLVGINTAIFSKSGGSLGIGFAVPASTARSVMEALLRDGHVVRGWIGVEPRELTPEIAQGFQLRDTHGVLIAAVVRDGPAGRGGMLPGDVVTKIGEQPVASPVQLLNAVAGLRPGSEALIVVQRADKAVGLTVKVARRPQEPRRQE